jgi:hypothetical protein
MEAVAAGEFMGLPSWIFAVRAGDANRAYNPAPQCGQ